MAKVHNDEVTKRLIEDAKLQLVEGIPSSLSNSIVPVMIANPKRVANCCIAGSLTNATSSTVTTTSSVKDTYITSFVFSFIKTSTATTSFVKLALRPFETGAQTDIVRLGTETLTSRETSISLALPVPIKLKRGSTILLLSETSNSTIKVFCTLQGYTVDTQ